MRVTMSWWLGKGKSPLGDVVCMPGKGRAGARSAGSWGGVWLRPGLQGGKKPAGCGKCVPEPSNCTKTGEQQGKLWEKAAERQPAGLAPWHAGCPVQPLEQRRFLQAKELLGAATGLRLQGCECLLPSESPGGGCSPACPPLVRGCLVLAVARPCGSVLGDICTQNGFLGVPRPGPKGEQTWSKRARQPEPPEEGCVLSSPRAPPAAPTPKRGSRGSPWDTRSKGTAAPVTLGCDFRSCPSRPLGAVPAAALSHVRPSSPDPRGCSGAWSPLPNTEAS